MYIMNILILLKISSLNSPKLISLLIGDCNLPSSNVHNAESYFNEKLSYFNFFQYNHICNVKNVILGYVIFYSLNLNVMLDIYCPICSYITFQYCIQF